MLMIEVLKSKYPYESENLVPIYKRAILSVPNANAFLWQYILIEVDLSLKLESLVELIDNLYMERKSPENSSCLVNCLIQLLLLSAKSDSFFQSILFFCIKICIGENATLHLDLNSNPVNYSVSLDLRLSLEKTHYCFFILCVICMLKFKYLPSNIFYDSPYDQLCHLDLFLIPWSNAGINEGNIQECELIFHSAFLHIEEPSSPLWKMVYRNRIEMLEYCLGIDPQSMAQIVSLQTEPIDEVYKCHIKSKLLTV
jgi:hypothetical protein